MKKSDLKVGMMIKTRANRVYIITEDKNGLYGSRVDSRMSLYDQNDDLTDDLSNYDIMEVYEVDNMSIVFKDIKEYGIIKINSECNLLWKREDVKEMNIEEIQKELGYKIKIVE